MANTKEIPGRVTFLDGNGDLPKLEITTAWSDAEIYLHGGHVTHFQRKGEPALLFMSQCSRFQSGSPIRGGIPVIFPWFGPREGQPQHGFARNKSWELKEIVPQPTGEIIIRLCFPDYPEAALWPKFSAEYIVTVGKTLSAELVMTNATVDQELTFQNCLHTYFNVGDIDAVSIVGLQGTEYYDKTNNSARKRESAERITIDREVDRTYINTRSTVEIHDGKLGRRILVEKSGSDSTVVWNPWIAKSQQMPDFGDDEYQRMVCVESGNVDDNSIVLGPGKSSRMKITLSSAPL